MQLRAVLHLDDDMLTRVSLAVDIIDQASFTLAVRKPFFVQKLYVGDLPLTFEQTVKEVD